MGSGGPRKTTTEVLSSTQNDELAVVAGCTQFRRPFHCYTVTLCKVMPPGGTTLCRYYWVSKSPPRRRRVWGQTQVFSVSLNRISGGSRDFMISSPTLGCGWWRLLLGKFVPDHHFLRTNHVEIVAGGLDVEPLQAGAFCRDRHNRLAVENREKPIEFRAE